MISALQNRTVKSKLPVTKPPSICGAGRPPLYKSYDQDNLSRAYEAVKEGRLSVRQAADQYAIPKSTLSDRISGKVKFGAHSGPARYLSDAEEEELAGFICRCARIGYAKTKKEILAIVEATLASKGKHVSLSNGWWDSFRERHSYLTLRPKPVTYAKKSGKILTSLEYRQEMEEKESLKKEKERLKEEKKREREAKKKERAKQADLKRQQAHKPKKKKSDGNLFTLS